MCVHKVWNLKYDTTKMNAPTNKDCIGWLLENCSLMGEEMKLLKAKDLNLLGRVFLMGEMSKGNELGDLALIEFL